MKNLSLEATAIFCGLIGLLDGKDILKITNEPYMPLTLERIGGSIATAWGEAEQFSLCHYYGQNGDLLQDPEMCFLLADGEQVLSTYGTAMVSPYSYQNACLGVYEESVSFMGAGVNIYLPRLHYQHLAFAEIWLRNIKRQGFLKY